MRRRVARTTAAPTGVAAVFALRKLSAWLHHNSDHRAAEALVELRRLHNAAWLSADQSVVEAYTVLERYDAVYDFLEWSLTHEGVFGYWPHRELTDVRVQVA